MDHLLKILKKKEIRSLCAKPMQGAAIHADDLQRTITTSKDAVSQQTSLINNFTKISNLKMNASKLEGLMISQDIRIQRN